MFSHPLIDDAIASANRDTIHADARRLGAARISRGIRPLATAGRRARLARWLTTSVLRAEPCPSASGSALS